MSGSSVKQISDTPRGPVAHTRDGKRFPRHARKIGTLPRYCTAALSTRTMSERIGVRSVRGQRRERSPHLKLPLAILFATRPTTQPK